MRTEFSSNENKRKGFDAEGFPLSSNGNPRFAYSYAENGIPLSVTGVSRRHSSIANLFYSYKSKYNADFSFTYDGTTAFGQKNMYQPFVSIGASWNLHREKFLIDVNWVDNLRVRATYGITGNQNFGSTSSVSTYGYYSDFNYFGQGVYLITLGNPNLEWQNTYQTNFGLDAQLWNKRFSMTLDFFRKYTNPLVIALTLPASTALSSYPLNMGNLTTVGAEANVSFAPWYKPKEGKSWFIGFTGTTLKAEYGGFGNSLEGINKELANSGSLTRYRDGYDSYDIWAVPSLGIDPATGKEIFLKKDGTQTFTYSADDQVRLGNSRPQFQGGISNSVRYKGFTLNMFFRYITGQDIMNTALYNKVENIGINSVITNNQDKRALYERWREPGDMSQYKAISLTTYTPISSRFIQRENTLSFESINLGYEFINKAWLNNLSIASLRVNAYTNDVFRISTVKRERGTSYPYARSFSVGINATFK
ncbi:MAG: hypothetical protein ACK5NK_07310 [Niabella sp.]